MGHGPIKKSITEEVQFYFKDYKGFITSDNQKLIAVISALNAANICHYNVSSIQVIY